MVTKLVDRFNAKSDPTWRVIGTIAIILIPILEGMEFTDPNWVNWKTLIYGFLVAVRVYASMTTADLPVNIDIPEKKADQ